ncbi:putative serine protease PepD [Arthrobacter sp. CAN_A214]|uniref:S1C family serine protease n=1 Tax=Arthrobacter sp. CAN_A214 TaxID=2787720 RepID=UPI0018C919FF
MTEQYGGPAGPERPMPPRPGNPPAWGTQETPGTGGGDYGQHAAYNGHQPYDAQQNAFQAHSGTFGQQVPSEESPADRKSRRRVGMGTFAAGVLVAGLIGGGVATVGSELLDDGAPASNAPAGASESIVVNNTDSVNEITGAAVTASPSVVEIAVSGPGSGGSGSGIILDDEGHILTNTHVVTLGGQVADPRVEVQLDDGRVFPAEVVGTDPLSDLAVIKVDAPDLTPATLGNSDELNVGDTAIAIGAPLGLSGTVTDGIVSTLNRTISVASSAVPEDQADSPEDSGDGFNFLPPEGSPEQQPQSQGSIYLNVIQTDAAINQGNSGGALIDAQGRIIGVNVAIASAGSGESSGNIGVGFSIPINYAERVAREIIEDGAATHGFLGVSVQETPPGDSGQGSTFSIGARVATVEPGSPAAEAELREGDVITKLGDYEINDPTELTAAVRMQPVGREVPVELTRDGRSITIDVALAAVPAP